MMMVHWKGLRKASATNANTLVFQALAAFLLAASSGLAFAQQMDAPPTIKDEPGKAESKKPDIDNGQKIARTLCTSCHLIGEPATTPVPSDVPTFASIANRPGQTSDHIATWLTRPHPPMPNLNLTRMEIRDLTGYILSLRKE
ncbi:MAG: hypothetical protein QM780_02750 [Hyphomicrobium sp.]|uniref:hypothetical protein n=1 Tax=Hyphomicrobium sp. TaxID=82 RepID=UPI0039E44638